MRIGILTGGGDVPGLNACIKAVTLRAEEGGLRHRRHPPRLGRASRVRPRRPGVRRRERHRPGRRGGPHDRPDGRDRAARRVRTPRRSRSRTSRPSCEREPAGRGGPGPCATRPEGARPAEDRRDGADRRRRHAFNFALRLHGGVGRRSRRRWTTAIHRTDYRIGFSTAVTRTVIFIHQLRTSAGSHERLAVRRGLRPLQRRDCAGMSAYLSGVERAIIGEVPFDVEKLAQMLTDDKRSNPSRYAMMTISEGATMVGGQMVMRRDRGRLRPPEARRDRRDHRRGAQGDHGRRHHLPAARLPGAGAGNWARWT